MECSRIAFFHLPDEILLMILKKLDHVEVLCSLMGINQRLDQIVSDSLFINEITLRKQTTVLELTSSLSDTVLDRFCSEILPKIHDQIQCLRLETFSIERVLAGANSYSNLCRLDLFLMNMETDMYLFTDQSPLFNILRNQIIGLTVNGKQDIHLSYSRLNRPAKIFINTLMICQKLRHFQFYTSVPIKYGFVLFGEEYPMFCSSTLLELHVTLVRFEDCLLLLDGRLSQLRVLFLVTSHILPLQKTIPNKDKLPNLKEFSLTCINRASSYEQLIMPHLQRIINLEKLALYFWIDCKKSFIDGKKMQKTIINYMPLLKQFTFNILSMIDFPDLREFPSNEDIHRTFTSFTDNQVISCVDYFPDNGYGQCHVYSCPYTLTHYENITNNFPGGLFQNIREVTLFDERPFEHEFFVGISQSFPYLTILTVHNFKAQQFKKGQNAAYEHRNFSLIEYSHLRRLSLYNVHDDYVEQFLVDIKTSLFNSIQLFARYEQLQRVTQHFTSDVARKNCSKITTLVLSGQIQLPEQYHTYFPHLE